MKSITIRLLEQAGIQVNGEQPHDIQINDERFFTAIARNPSLGAGESYMQGWWDCAALDELFYKVHRHSNIESIYSKPQLLWYFLRSKLLNLQSIHKAKDVADTHYNIDNDLYQAMLGDSMAYTCGYWKQAKNLEQAQQAKYQLVCDKLQLQANDRLLDLGCGWGGFSRYAASHYGCEVVAVNIAQEQLQWAQTKQPELNIKYFLADYRQPHIYNPQNHPFTKIATIGLCEHVGRGNYDYYINLMASQLSETGLLLLHTIGRKDSKHHADPWIRKYIFPHGILPSLATLTAAAESCTLIEDLHNFGADYAHTLQAWEKNFVAHWPQLEQRFDERFYRMWRYYLLSCAGAFRARSLQLWQLVLSKRGILNGYRCPR